MNKKPYAIGIDPGLNGAIAVIDQYLENSFAMRMELRDWNRPVLPTDVNLKAVPKKNKKKATDVFDPKSLAGERYKIAHPLWGSQIVDMEKTLYILDKEYYQSDDNYFDGLFSFLEEPGNIGVKKFSANLTVGNNIGLINEAIRTLTGNDSIRVSPSDWQDHPIIKTWGKVDWEHGAKTQKEAKKHFAISVVENLFKKSLSYSTDDGLADALLIGLYGALLFPPVIKYPPALAGFYLHHSSSISIDSNIPFPEALIYAEERNSLVHSRVKDCLLEPLGIEPPPLETLPAEGIIGYVTLGDFNRPNMPPEQASRVITSRRVYPTPIPFDMTGKTVTPYLNQLPHLIH
jgi:hypothetical protein